MIIPINELNSPSQAQQYSLLFKIPKARQAVPFSSFLGIISKHPIVKPSNLLLM